MLLYPIPYYCRNRSHDSWHPPRSMASIEPWCKWFFLQSSAADQLPSPDKLAAGVQVIAPFVQTKGSGSCSSQLVLFTIKDCNDLTTVCSFSVCTRAHTKGRLPFFRLAARLPDDEASSSARHLLAYSWVTPSSSVHTRTAANARPGSATG